MPDNDRTIAQSHIELEERIRSRAHEIWLMRANREDDDRTALDDWLQAEREVLGEDSHQPAQDRGATVGSARRPVTRVRHAG